jgi:protein gp37
MAYSKIEWTDSTWNPLTGCTKVSDGCQNCYAERMSKRLHAMGNPNYINEFTLTLHPDSLELPLKWKTPQMIFVNSMSDLFHESVPEEYIVQIFNIMEKANWHVFQILTKRSKRLLELSDKLRWSQNIWMGVTVENEKYVNRIEDLQKTKAVIKFISFEPLLGPVTKPNLLGIDWAIVGGESGPHARPINPAWVRNIREECLLQKTRFFFKQWGGTNRKKTGRILDGKIWNEMPGEISNTFL